MNASPNLGPDGNDREFVTEADWIPGFWNYLLDLDRDDLIAELIQNDLDQDATRTLISFEQDHLICEGNGKPVEPDGWKRLRKIQGAGDSVPAKRGKIGVKNHGLKTAFTIGDEIRLMSDKQMIVQTLYANGRKKPPYPGASPIPLPDPSAPANGCRIVIRYRRSAIEPRQGEANVHGAISNEEIDALFLAACANAPEQFAGIVSPEIAPRYEIVLRHWRLGEARFEFSCSRPRRIAKRIELFRRRCLVSGTLVGLPEGLLEQGARRLVPLKGRLRQRIADFFRRGKQFFVEVSWPVDGHGRPKIGTGRFRYPIGYPTDSHEARTGHGAYFNAPIASDNKRHGPARNEATNGDLRQACETLLIDVLAHYAVPRWGADGLNPLVPSPGAENKDQAIRPLLSVIAKRGAMPTLSWTAATHLIEAKTRKSKAAAPRQLALRRSAVDRRYQFVIPVPTWAADRVDRALSILSPPSELQLDPRTHTAIIDLLTDQRTEGFKEVFVTFDEMDAFARLTEGGNAFFDAMRDPKADLAHPFVAGAYLDLIQDAISNESCDADTADSIQNTLFLPEARGQSVPFRDLQSSAVLPSGVPGLKIPPIVHPDLAEHRLFRRRDWQRPRYTMARFLESGALQNSDENTRKLFWNWLRRNERRIKPRERPKLADLPIWPDENGRTAPLNDLCDPRSRRVALVLRNVIRQPHDEVRRSRLVSSTGKARTTIRHMPTELEVEAWLDDRLASCLPNSIPDSRALLALSKLESDLAILLQDAGIARLLKSADVSLPALAQDGSICARAGLVMPSRAVDRLALPAQFLLKNKRLSHALDKLSPARVSPTAAMLLDAFSEDGVNFSALQARLQQFVSLTELGDHYRSQLANVPIIPVHGKALPPSALAFTGSKGDFWGAWKTRLSGQGLSQDDQRRYREIGVTSAMPNWETSRAFFAWLSAQPQLVVQRHIPCILRHILHRDGPVQWANNFTEIAFIPARSQNRLELLPLRGIHRRPVYLPDAEDVAEMIVRQNSNVLLVIDQVKEVSEPIREPLRGLGVRSLREALQEPESVLGEGETVPAGTEVLERLQALRSNHFRTTFLKRLTALGVEQDLVWRDWHDRLSRIREIRFSARVEARYRFHGKLYTVPSEGGFDPASGTFWVKTGSDINFSNFYEAVAAQLIFKPSARPVHYLALERALELEIRDRSYGRPNREDESVEDAADGGTQSAPGDQDEDDDTDPGEAVFGHSPFKPDPSRNSPNPGSISSNPTGSSRKHSRNGSGSGGNTSPPKPTPELELEHVEALKRNHYASHCQMCLCERAPRELAPLGSYIQWEEVRRRVVEAHHVDLKSAGGARHAGNLILVCKLHHDNFGRRLTRSAITAALQCDPLEKIVQFGAGGDSVTEISGRQITLAIPDTGEVVALFFTTQHADYWLSQARPLADAAA